MRMALESGGCIKFDLKAWDERIHVALAGRSNRQTLANFARAAQMAAGRPDPPALVASTLLVPGYVDTAEVAKIAAFIAGIDRDIPYALLGFHPQFYLHDLPVTSRAHAEAAVAVAKAAGLRRVHIGNRHVLGDEYGIEDPAQCV
jgi:pyruvate formate lyase activating enzyme